MADTVSKAKRSEIMSHIKGKETEPEIIVRKYLFSRGLRYRKNVKNYQVLRISFCRNIKQSYWSMVAFGMVIKVVDQLIYHLLI